jgi:hypothetical protein
MINKILLILCFAFVSITSTYAQEKASTAQDEINIRKSPSYQTALKAFKSGDFKESFKLFGELSSQHSGNEHVEFYYGRSAFELKKYELAFSAFDRVLIANENNHRARLELARTLFLMKAYKQSKVEFERVLLAPIPKTVRTQINKFVKMIGDKESGYVLNKVAIFGLGWSDNVENTANPYLAGATLNSPDKKEDFSFRAIVVGNLIAPFKNNSRLTSESTAVLFLQEQDTVKTSNLFVTSLSSGLGYAYGNFKHLTSLTYDYIWIDGKRNMSFYGLSYNMKTKIKRTDMLSLDFKIKNKNMVKSTDSIKDSRIYELGLSYKMPIEKDSITLSTNFTKELKDGGTQLDINKEVNKYKVSYDKKLFANYTTVLDYQYEVDKYEDMSAFNGSTLNEKRKDIIHNITLKVSRKLDKKSTVGIELSHIKNDTNHDAYSYEKKNALVNYTILF